LPNNAGVISVNEPMSKARLLAELRTAREEWEKLLTDVDYAQMIQVRAVGDWSIKGVIFHATRYADLFVEALAAHLRGEPPPPDVLARPTIDERNSEHFRQSEQRTPADVLAESRQVFDHLVTLVEAHPDAFLLEPQRFEGVSDPILVWEYLLHVCSHYGAHRQDIRAAMAKHKLSG
jgi:hypothetical protein